MQLTGAEIVVRCLQEEGVEHVFCLDAPDTDAASWGALLKKGEGAPKAAEPAA